METRASLCVSLRDTEETERHFTVVKSRTDLKDLQDLFIRQQQLEADISSLLKLDVKPLEEQTARLQLLCPEKVQVMDKDIKETIKIWTELQGKVQGNNRRIQSAGQLRRFFHSYLEMISWTEDTRAEIFLESPGERVSPNRREQLDRRMEEKLREFEDLARDGWKFIREEHSLRQTIKERLEELQGMLGWVVTTWRDQKHQRIVGSKGEWQKSKDLQDSTQQVEALDGHRIGRSPPEVLQSHHTSLRIRGATLRRYGRKAHSPVGAEVQEEISGCSDGPVWLEPRRLPTSMGLAEAEEDRVKVRTLSGLWKVQSASGY
ncbi:hypothetical protein GDO86_013634 [Hymenochirus boettgeri]|uniref:Uncharacterized protein n=1 Tax=Hymenochirus boettgeri TaxID=247094 RepID=A0A8T2IS72_9PIPI|nr:hypothetical protein GDO86_013634 [Hymenochirus boettgeri]